MLARRGSGGGAAGVLWLSLLLLAPAARAAAKEKLMSISWGDVIWEHQGQGVAQLDTPEKVQQAARTWKAHGVTTVLFRVDDFRNAPLKGSHDETSSREFESLAVVSLPAGVFKPYAGVKTSVLVFRRPASAPEEGTSATKRVWFYEVQNDGYDGLGIKPGRRQPV